jgi:hypothetical protein
MTSSDLCIDSDQGEGRHSRLKGHNSRTNLNNATPQIIGIDVREAVHARMTYELSELDRKPEEPQVEAQEAITDLRHGYHIAAEERPSNRVYLPDFLREHQGDPAVTVRCVFPLMYLVLILL